MSRKGENIYKRKDGRWEGRYIRQYDLTGKAVYGSVYGKTYREVKKKLIEKKSTIQQKQNRKQPIQEDTCVIYGDLLTVWLTSTKLQIKESTYARYSQLVNKHIRPILGSSLTTSITTKTIESFIEHLLTSGRLDRKGGLSPKTVADILAIIRSTSD